MTTRNKWVKTVGLAWLGFAAAGVGSLDGATYYVSPSGNDANDGSGRATSWRTLVHAASQVTGGDIVRVQNGTYHEQPIVELSGREEAWITFVADGKVVCRGFGLKQANYVRIIGFEITHVDNTFWHAFSLQGNCSHIEILDNYIHNTRPDGAHIRSERESSTSYITIRGNRFFHLGWLEGVFTNANTAAVSSLPAAAHHWLVEYNTMQRCTDGINAFGTNNIIRNNYYHDVEIAYWPGTPAPERPHPDGFQPGSDGQSAGTRHHIYEGNFLVDSRDENSHFGIWHDTIGDGDTNIVWRGNVAANFGAGGIGVIGTDKCSAYNNTFHDMNNLADSGTIFLAYGQPGLNCLFANGLISRAGNSTDPLDLQHGSTGTFTHNLGYLAASEESYVSTNDPLFIDPANRNFRLQANSPAIDAGTNLIWVTSASSSGTTFAVNDPLLLCDGWGLVEGDTITVGGTITRIASIRENSITVATPVTWTNLMPVCWGTDAKPDIGAFPYGSAELTSASLTRTGITYTVTTTGDARGVWFYVDGIPSAWDNTPPYTATIASGRVSARAYALYAQANPVVIVRGGAPASPTGLRIIR